MMSGRKEADEGPELGGDDYIQKAFSKIIECVVIQNSYVM